MNSNTYKLLLFFLFFTSALFAMKEKSSLVYHKAIAVEERGQGKKLIYRYMGTQNVTFTSLKALIENISKDFKLLQKSDFTMTECTLN